MPKKDYKNLELDPKYIPKKTEEYMSVQQKAYFYNLLNAQREELVSSMENVMSAINLGKKNDTAGTGDEADTANFDIEADMQTRMHQRSINLLKQVDAALARLEDGKYGYSVVSGIEIGLKRLLARPLATMTLEEREEYEKKKQ